MPLDSSTCSPVTERIATPTQFWAATLCERLEMLSFALRQPLINWDWDFGVVEHQPIPNCNTAGCAIGYAHALWGAEEIDSSTVEMSDGDFWRIFLNNSYYLVPWANVTPIMVADAIDAYLAVTP